MSLIFKSISKIFSRNETPLSKLKYMYIYMSKYMKRKNTISYLISHIPILH